MAEKTCMVLFGGKSSEYEISCASAAFVADVLKNLPEYQTILVGISKEGRFLFYEGDTASMRDLSWIRKTDKSCYFTLEQGDHKLYFRDGSSPVAFDVVFPVLHGKNGEDGRLQGMLEMADIPFVGCGMTASTLAMDKAFANLIFNARDILHTPWLKITEDLYDQNPGSFLSEVEAKLEYPLFVKPARAGSSIGITMANDETELKVSLATAFAQDGKVVVEQAVKDPLELEVAVMGNATELYVSPVGEIVPDRKFYDYDSKYSNSQTKLLIPAEISNKTSEAIRAIAKKAYLALDCFGLARVDFLLSGSETIYLNEINTIPGFVDISMYPRLFRAYGFSNEEIIKKLLAFAFKKRY